jgi:DNA modification methylase
MIEIENITLRNLHLRESLPQETVDIADKKRSNLFTWRGQFSPQLIESLIENYAKDNDVLFDPFVGSGTLLMEAALFGLEVHGTELNPAAYGLASIYKLSNISFSERENSIEIVENIIEKYFPIKIDGKHPKSIEKLKNELVNQLIEKVNSIEGVIINALIIGLDFEQKKLDSKKLKTAWDNLKETIKVLPFTGNPIHLQLGDARQTNINNSSIDIVITSPPYINVFNYHQNYRKSVEATGFNVLEVAKSEIGSNRKFRSNRFLTVIQYSLDIYQVFQELKRVCKKDAKVIFIVGRESSVRKTSFSNAKLLTEVACSLGFKLEGEQPRVFKNKFGQNIYEEILRFSISQNFIENITIENAREIAIKHMIGSLNKAPQESLSDLKEAIAKADKVQPSQLYIKK